MEDQLLAVLRDNPKRVLSILITEPLAQVLLVLELFWLFGDWGAFANSHVPLQIPGLDRLQFPDSMEHFDDILDDTFLTSEPGRGTHLHRPGTGENALRARRHLLR